ncbi:superoxide dismutase family protein [Nonomuraea jiangxiensis]|uniref:Superoxide dismutase, Cu-Zn family n=1 Tax=Nonomuraea jiangxiensis TaxID=633440 RepID=A0A1G9A6A3_9ACTN|nr:superoxide dismutase family protein [Nonomuraea jiangxiensis]SDK22899.1 superoxide dismutase, Cu-Zn family [Nonomuraea jiangxiensis]
MRVPAFLLVLLTAAGAGGCAGAPAPLQNAPGTSPATPGTETTLTGGGEFTSADTSAIAYDRKLAPKGSQASVTAESTAKETRTSLVVEGLRPNRTYGAHLHAKPCGKRPDDSGPHFQHHPGQINPASEVWLDIKTNASGTGRSTARNEWALDPTKLPGSLVIHAKPTVTSGPKVGTAGDRVACLTLTRAT